MHWWWRCDLSGRWILICGWCRDLGTRSALRMKVWCRCLLIPSPQLYGSDVEIEVIYKITFGDFIFVYCYCYCLWQFQKLECVETSRRRPSRMTRATTRAVKAYSPHRGNLQNYIWWFHICLLLLFMTISGIQSPSPLTIVGEVVECSSSCLHNSLRSTGF